MSAFEDWLYSLTWLQFWLLFAAILALPSMLLVAGDRIATLRHRRRAAAIITAPASKSISWREQAAVEAARRARAHLSTVPISDREWAEIVAVIEQAGAGE